MKNARNCAMATFKRKVLVSLSAKNNEKTGILSVLFVLHCFPTFERYWVSFVRQICALSFEVDIVFILYIC